MTMAWLLTALAVVPLAVFPLTAFLGRRSGWPLAAVMALLALAMLPEAGRVLDGEPVTQEVAWVPALGVDLALRMDGLGLVFVAIALVIGAVVLAYSVEYLPDGRQVDFYAWMTAFTFSMVALVLVDDLVLLFLTWELTSLASFFLIARSGSAGEAASRRTLFMTFVGGLSLLLAVVVTIAATGSTSLSEALGSDIWSRQEGLATVVATLVLVSGFTKAAQFPFHPWLPDAMAAATPVSAYLHAAAVVKAGIYLMLRFSEAFRGVPVWNVTLISVGLFTSAMAALFALQQTDLKKLMAYSTVSQLGLITATIGIGTQAALTAAVLHTIAHALFKSGLFMMVGVVDHAAGTRDIRRLPALGRVMPWSLATVVLGTAAMAGLPPLIGFVSKEAIFAAMLEAPGPAWAGPAALAGAVGGAMLTFAYCAKIVYGAFIDGTREVEDAHEAGPLLLVPAALPIWVGLPLALGVGVLDAPVGAAVTAMAGEAHPHLAFWHGVNLELALSGLVVLVGLLIIRGRRTVRARLEQRPLLPRDGAWAIELVAAVSARLGRRFSHLVEADHPIRHVTPPLVALATLLVGGSAWLLVGGDLPAPREDLWRWVDVALLALIVLAVVGVCLTRSRIGGAVFLSGVGIAVTVQLFSLGAPDVGLTQLMVEVLTITVIMLVLRMLPATFHRPRPQQRSFVTLALSLGVGAGFATWLLTGRRDRSDPAEYYLSEGYDVSGATNLVNVILVEFRALDTLGELAVLGMAGVAIVAVLRTVPRGQDEAARDPGLRPHRSLPDPQASRAMTDAAANLVPMRLLLRVLLPALVVLALVIFYRGHNEPGGGFIAALVAAVGLALLYLARSTDRPLVGGPLPVWLIGGGVLVALGTGVIGYVKGSFLEPLHTYVGEVHLTTSMLFDVGVSMAVLGMVLAAFDLLGGPRDPGPGLQDPHSHRVADPTEANR